MTTSPSFWLTVLIAAIVTYFWRALGVLVGGRIRADGPLFEWIGCVAYVLLAGLTARMILLPIGPLATTHLASRLLASVVALLVLRLSRGNIAAGVAAGVVTLTALNAAGVLPHMPLDHLTRP